MGKYLDRNMALSFPFANGKYDKRNANREFILGCEAYREWLESLPIVSVLEEFGHWERHYCEDGNADGWKCSECGEWFYFGDTLPNFCPKCGAKMDFLGTKKTEWKPIF